MNPTSSCRIAVPALVLLLLWCGCARNDDTSDTFPSLDPTTHLVSTKVYYGKAYCDHSAAYVWTNIPDSAIVSKYSNDSVVINTTNFVGLFNAADRVTWIIKSGNAFVTQGIGKYPLLNFTVTEPAPDSLILYGWHAGANEDYQMLQFWGKQ